MSAELFEQAENQGLLLALGVDVVLAALDGLENDVGRVGDAERVAREGESGGSRPKARWRVSSCMCGRDSCLFDNTYDA